jgi:glycosyltransferase involved in cell wall biosynthesis
MRALRSTFERFGLHGEILLVDDGSTDGTGDAARREAEGWDRVRVLTHRRNLGKTEALVTAADATLAEWLIVLDADLQYATDEIPRFLAKLDEGWDIVTGRKVGEYEKQAVSGLYNRISHSLFRVPVSDLNSMKAFRRRILEEVYLRHDWHRFFVVLAFARGFSVTEIDVALHPRRHGVSKYTGKGRIVVGLLDLVSVGFFLFISRKPLILFGSSGILLVILGVLVGLGTLTIRLADWTTPFGIRPFLYLTMLLETLGFLLFGFGLLAELIAQQRAELEALKRRLPAASVDDELPPKRR